MDRFEIGFPYYSPYLFAGDNPIKFIDAEGLFQVDPSIAQDYPIIYQYLTTQIESDVMNSPDILNAYKTLNPLLPDYIIREDFANNSGPTLSADPSPGLFPGAVGKFESDGGTGGFITINSKLFKYVENILESKTSSDDDKQLALTYLYQEVIHETSHHFIRFGGYVDGHRYWRNDRETSNAEEQLPNSTSGEPGYFVERLIWGTPEQISTDDTRPIVKGLEGLEPNNPKFKQGQTEGNVKKAREQGRKVLPTVPKKNSSSGSGSKGQNKGNRDFSY